MRECIAAVRQGLKSMSDDSVDLPLRHIVELPNKRSMLGFMPGWTSVKGVVGAKVTAMFPENAGTAFSSHQGAVLLFEPVHGSLVGIVDGSSITAIRTAAASAVATDILAAPESRHLAILGYGEQASRHLLAMSLIRQLKHVTVWGRDPDKAAAFAHDNASRFEIDVRVAPSAQACVEGAHIICTVTAAAEPILFLEQVHAGAHVNAVGSSRAKEVEIDPRLFAAAQVYADYVPGVMAQGGEFLRAKQAGLINDQHVLGSIGDLLAGRVDFNRTPGAVTLFKSIGLIVEDLVAAQLALARAAIENRGLRVDW